MLFIVFSILGIYIVDNYIIQANELSKDTASLRKLLETMDSSLMKFRVNSKFSNLMYGEVSQPPLYDYPEVWWTERAPGTTIITLNTNTYHYDTDDTTKTTLPSNVTHIFALNSTKTLKPTLQKKTIEVAKKIKRVKKIRKSKNKNVAVKVISKATTNTEIQETTKLTGKNYYIINRDEAHGDLSVEDDGANIRVDKRTNKNSSRIHASVLSGLTLRNNTQLSDFDYVIYDGRDNYDKKSDTNENKSHKLPVIIKILKAAELNESINYLKKGAHLLLGPENSANFPKIIRDGINRTYHESMVKSNITLKTESENTPHNFTTVKQEIENNLQVNENKSPVNLAQFFQGLVSKHATTQPYLKKLYQIPKRDLQILVEEHGLFTNPTPFETKPTFNPGTKFNYFKDPQNFMREQLELAKKNFEAEAKIIESSKTTELSASFKTNLDPLITSTTVAGTKQFDNAALILSNIEKKVLEHVVEAHALTKSNDVVTSSWHRPEFHKPPIILSSYVKNLIAMMKELKMGYFSVALIDLFDSLAHKSVHDAGVLMKGYQREVDTMLNFDHMFYLGKLLVDSLLSIADYIMRSPPDMLQSQVKILHNVMLNRRDILTLDINSVLDFIDTMYTEEEGIKLFIVMEKIRDFPKGEPTVIQLHRELTDAAYHPLITLKYSPKRKIALGSINKILENNLWAPTVGRRHITKMYTQSKQNRKSKASRLNRLNFGRHNINLQANYTTPILSYELETTPTITLISKKKKNNTTRKITNFKRTTSTLHKALVIKNRNTTPELTTTEKSFKGYKDKYKNQSQNLRNMTVEKASAKGMENNQKKTEEIANVKAMAMNVEENIKHHKRRKLRKKLKKLKRKHPKMYKKYLKHKRKPHTKKKHKTKKRHSKLKKSKFDKYMQKYTNIEKKYEKLLKHYASKSNLKAKHKKHVTVINLRKKNDKRSIARQLIKRKYLTTPRLTLTIEKQFHIPMLSKGKTGSAFVFPPLNFVINKTLQKDTLFKKFLNFQEKLKNKKIMQSSSYSDEEDTLKTNIYDALRRRKDFNQYRRHGDPEIHGSVKKSDSANKFNRLSSYSSEETVLKSKIYNGLIFNNYFNE